MTAPITLQIATPSAMTLDEAELARITGRTQRAAQMAWLREHGWAYELTAGGAIVVGALYAHLRLAGLHPVDVTAQAAAQSAAGFNMSAVR